ncbi:MAG: photosynthetic reaction center subunit H [Pseudomonadota bacterium]
MGTGAITEYIDVAQVVLYVFWLFFAFLVLYLHRESKREGYPLKSTSKRGVQVEGFPGLPRPKTFVLPHGGGTRTVPGEEAERHDIAPEATGVGTPIRTADDPMAAGLGPGSYAIRPEVPDLTHEGEPKIVPLRVATDHALQEKDPDPRGQPVYGVDGEIGGTVVDAWIDRSEPQIRYFEVDANGRRILLPITFSRVNGRDGSIKVKSIKAEHFQQVPTLANPDQVTLQEEDRICAFYGGGYLYALPTRTEPLV